MGFEPKISAGERPQTHAFDRAATGNGDRGTPQYWILKKSDYIKISN